MNVFSGRNIENSCNSAASMKNIEDMVLLEEYALVYIYKQ